MALRVTCIAALTVVLAACSTTIARVEGADHKRPDPKTQMAALERRIYEVIEQERTTIDPKAKPLALDSELTGVARARSADMAAKHYVAHKAPDGETAATLIMARDASFQGLLAENIAAQHYAKEDGIDVDALAKRFVDTWLASKSATREPRFAGLQPHRRRRRRGQRHGLCDASVLDRSRIETAGARLSARRSGRGSAE